MKTRDALKILSKGQVDYPDRINSPLLERSGEYLDAFEAREREILAKQNANSLQLPFLETLRKKVSKIVSGPDQNLPIVARFDLYTGIRKMAERSPKDNGLNRLATHLEKGWHSEPMGTMTYGQVAGLVSQWRDKYPRSKAADAIEAECTRVGLHKLPVAKLARIASKINSQADYDVAMESNGYAGDRSEQVRARALVRGLVELRGAAVDSHQPTRRDDRNVAERVGDRVASLHNAGYEQAQQTLEEARGLAANLVKMLNGASSDLLSDGLEQDGQALWELAAQLEAWTSELQLATNDVQPDAQAGAPAMVSPAPAELLHAARAASKHTRGKLKAQITAFARSLSAQMNLRQDPNSDPRHEELETPAEEGLEHELGLEVNPEMMDGAVQQNELETGVDIVEEIDELAQELIQEAPPEAQDWIQHEMDEGHTAPPGTAEWGAEEILNEGHTAPPPTDEWLAEELEELEGGMGAPDEMGAPMGPPAAPPMGRGGQLSPRPPGAPGAKDIKEMRRMENPMEQTHPVRLEDTGAGGLDPDSQGMHDPDMSGAWEKDEPASLVDLQQEISRLEMELEGGDPLNAPFEDAPMDAPFDEHESAGPSDEPMTFMQDPEPARDHDMPQDIRDTMQKDRPGTPGKVTQETTLPSKDEQGPFEELTGKKLAKGKGNGIPLPGKIKTHPNVTTYAKEVSKDGGKTLTADYVEKVILSGKTIKVGDLSIKINANNEVEVWNKEAGRGCDLLHLDTAIADFMAMVNAKRAKVQANRLNVVYRIAELVNVPCEVCGDITLFEKAASIEEDAYGCACGNLVEAASFDAIMKYAQAGAMFQLTVGFPYQEGNPNSKKVRDHVMRSLTALTKGNMKVEEESRGNIVATLWNMDTDEVDVLVKKMHQMGARPAEARRVAQNAPSGPYVNNPTEAPRCPECQVLQGKGHNRGCSKGASKTAQGELKPLPQTPKVPPPSSAPSAPAGGMGEDMPEMDFQSVATAAFMNYAAQGMSGKDAMKTFMKEHGDRWEDDPAQTAAVMGAFQMYFGGSAAAPPAAPGAPGAPAAPATPPAQPGATTMMAALRNAADSRMKTPSVRKPKDHVSVPKDLGTDSETKGGIPAPGTFKSQPNKTQHQKLSPKELGPDSETKDLLPDPGVPKTEHDPKKNKGIRLPPTKLDKDTEGDDPFKVPALGAKPSAKKGQAQSDLVLVDEFDLADSMSPYRLMHSPSQNLYVVLDNMGNQVVPPASSAVGACRLLADALHEMAQTDPGAPLGAKPSAKKGQVGGAKIVEIPQHSDEVSGAFVFDDGAKVFWSGDGTRYILVTPGGQTTEVDAAAMGWEKSAPPAFGPYLKELSDTHQQGSAAPARSMSPEEEAEADGILGHSRS